MKFLSLFLALVIAVPCFAEAPTVPSKKVFVVDLKGPVDEQSETRLIQSLRVANLLHLDSVLIVINSPGGRVDSMQRIVKAIQSSQVPIACVADGEAASAAAIILESCQLRAATPLTLILFHGAATAIQGNEKDIQGALDVIRAINEGMMVFLSMRLGLPVEEIQKMVDHDFWFGPLTGLRIHALDGIVASVGSLLEYLKNNDFPVNK